MKKMWRSMVLAATGLLLLTTSGCGPSFPGTIELVKTLVESPVVGMSLHQDKYLYVVDEDGKLLTYDISKPEEPKKLSQADAFKDEGYQIGYEVTSQWLVLVGKSGKIALFDIRSPESPSPVWTAGKSLKLKGAGPFVIRSDSPIMYVTPTSGAAILRVDLATLGNQDTEQDILDAATKTIAGDGGGGIALPYTDEKIPLRIYVGNKKTGKLDIWDINKVESGSADKPVASIDLKAGTGIKAIHVYQEEAFAIRGYLVALSDSGEIEYLDLDNRYRKADDPVSLGTASVPGLFHFDGKSKVIISDQLNVFDFSAELITPTAYAEPNIAQTAILRSMVVHKNYIYTAEAGGLRLYKYGAAPN